MTRTGAWLCCLGISALLVRTAIAQDHAKSEKSTIISASSPAGTPNSSVTHDDASPAPGRDSGIEERLARVEGEKRFRTNCGRCHQPPHKFPPRVIATAIRHMRVRAMITDEDMRLILKYMTE
ncbi:MAG TPA: cytochrome c [Candidatus Acidoferrum sp.]|nr:cytochrome c [Candidatus Acidoferrum sp.]